MIIANLARDTSSLLACSMICNSWYTATFPHLHRTLITQPDPRCTHTKFTWPKPLQDMRKLGLLPLVKRFHFHGGCYSHNWGLNSKRLNRLTLPHFSALTNVRELGIDFLDISSFGPRIQRYFGHFSSTVRSPALKEPKGSCRQIVYFIGLFEHLEDLKLIGHPTCPPQGVPAHDRAPIPLFVPPLRGRLTMTWFWRVGVLEEMINLFGGIRFRWMSLYAVEGMQLLLGASAKTLETLWLYPTDPRGKELPPNAVQVLITNLIVGCYLRDFDLSRNKSLRALHVAAWSPLELEGFCLPYAVGKLLSYVLPTIESHVFSGATIFYRHYNAYSKYPSSPCRSPLRETLSYEDEMEEEASLRTIWSVSNDAQSPRLSIGVVDCWKGVGHSQQAMEVSLVAKMTSLFREVAMETQLKALECVLAVTE